MKQKSNRRSRRHFLQAAGAMAAVPSIVPSTVFGAAAPSSRVSTALIGSGGRGQQIMGGGDRVIAVCDVDSKKAAQAQATINAKSGGTGCDTCKDFREVLARDDVDAVIIGTPDHWHVPVAAAAIKAGKAVYVEKPLSLFITEGRQLADLARRYGTILQVGSQQRSFEQFLRACELVRNGRIGDLKTVEVEIYARPGKSDAWTGQPVPPELDYNVWLGQAPWSPYHPLRVHYNFRFVTDFSGGDITNWGAHHLDIAQWGIGASESGPVEVVGHGKRNATGLHDCFYDVHVDFTYANGVVVELRSKQSDVGTGHVRFVGTKGWIQVSREYLKTEPASLATSRIGPDEIHLDPDFGDRGLPHMGRWLEAIKTRHKNAINVTAEIGHRSATVCHLANIAMQLGRKLQWDPDKEVFVGDDQANRLASRTMRQPWRL